MCVYMYIHHMYVSVLLREAIPLLTCDSSLAVVSDLSCSLKSAISETKCCFSRSHSASGANGLLVLRWWPSAAPSSGTVVSDSPMEIGDSSRPAADANGFSVMVLWRVDMETIE